MKNLNKKSDFLFVVGTGRSGTTFLAQDLGRIGEEKIFSIPYETAFFIDTYNHKKLDSKNLRKRIDIMLNRAFVKFNYAGINEEIYDYLEKSPKLTYKELFIALSKTIASREGYKILPSTVIEKTPTHIFHTHKILREFNDAKIIIIERSPFSVISSSIKYGINRLKILPLSRKMHILAQFWEWKRNFNQARKLLKKVPKHQILLINYDDLILNPEEIREKLSEFLGLKLEKNFLIKEQTLKKYQDFFSESELDLVNSFLPKCAYLDTGRKNKISILEYIEYFLVTILCSIEVFLVNYLPFSIKMSLKKIRGDVDVPIPTNLINDKQKHYTTPN